MQRKESSGDTRNLRVCAERIPLNKHVRTNESQSCILKLDEADNFLRWRHNNGNQWTRVNKPYQNKTSANNARAVPGVEPNNFKFESILGCGQSVSSYSTRVLSPFFFREPFIKQFKTYFTERSYCSRKIRTGQFGFIPRKQEINLSWGFCFTSQVWKHNSLRTTRTSTEGNLTT
jgi:hypothetical protein